MVAARNNDPLTAEMARSLFTYDPDSGTLRWKVSRGSKAPAGREAGLIQSSGYRRVGVDGLYYMAHRIIWLLVTGCWPSGEIDHANRDRTDNRWCNLRDATVFENRRNTRLRKPKGGVYRPAKGKYVSSIRVDGKRLFLGEFDTQEEARAAYRAAAIQHHGEFAAW